MAPCDRRFGYVLQILVLVLGTMYVVQLYLVCRKCVSHVTYAHHYLARYVIPVDVAMQLCEDAALAFRFLSESRGRN